jgi:segregation and condensation protein B
MFGSKRVTRVESESTPDSESENEGFSLEDLGTAYAQALDKSNEPAHEGDLAEHEPSEGGADKTVPRHGQETETLTPPIVSETDGVAVQPESIIEAMLFLGASNNEPLSSQRILELIRGMNQQELVRIIDGLNQRYRQNGRAFEIVADAGGYRLQLSQDLWLVRDRFYGKVKETQLTQSAIDCLALVAYQPGITRAEIEAQWNQPASNMLATLVRRGLLKVEKSDSSSGSTMQFFTTDRFLEIAGLSSLSDLPSSEEA